MRAARPESSSRLIACEGYIRGQHSSGQLDQESVMVQLFPAFAAGMVHAAVGVALLLEVVAAK